MRGFQVKGVSTHEREQETRYPLPRVVGVLTEHRIGSVQQPVPIEDG
jgi:hypothetical protein